MPVVAFLPQGLAQHTLRSQKARLSRAEWPYCGGRVVLSSGERKILWGDCIKSKSGQIFTHGASGIRRTREQPTPYPSPLPSPSPLPLQVLCLARSLHPKPLPFPWPIPIKKPNDLHNLPECDQEIDTCQKRNSLDFIRFFQFLLIFLTPSDSVDP